jgi:UDP-N-acetylglucosamine diphosphorylase/glucosamine-1-phosphate N-acetyltransferase
VISYDDARARQFEPFAHTRPWSEMRVGALLIRERWQHVLGASASGFLSGEGHAHFQEFASPVATSGEIPAGTLVVNSRCAVQLHAVTARAPVYVCNNRVAAVLLTQPVHVSRFANGTLALDELAREHHGEFSGATLNGMWCDEVWDVTRALGELLAADIHALSAAPDVTRLNAHQHTVLGEHGVYLEAGARVEPQVVFDTAAGPILLCNGAVVQAFTRLVGPCYVGAQTTISGGRVANSAFGEQCKVNGEVSTTVFIGHANKGHDGFVGHSVLGRWVNLGAGTTTSNLKNTYGAVALWTPDGVRDTGLQFLGTMFGDHVKTGIGLRLTTGCVLGAGANIVDQMPPKVVAPFAFGSGAPYDLYAVDKFIQTATRVMLRRGVTLGDGMQQHLRDAYSRSWKAE